MQTISGEAIARAEETYQRVLESLAQMKPEAIKALTAFAESRIEPEWDIERVFWDSAYQLGFLFLGYLAVKGGFLIAELQGLIENVGEWIQDPYADDPTRLTEAQFNTLYPWCDPAGSKYRDPPPQGPIGMAIYYYRQNPVIWNQIKAQYVDPETGQLKVNPYVEVLTFFDGLYTEFGPVAPLGVLGFNVIKEKRRTSQ